MIVDYASMFVDSKKKRLRLMAFAVVNKMDVNFPKAKVAVIMRAYRKPEPHVVPVP